MKMSSLSIKFKYGICNIVGSRESNQQWVRQRTEKILCLQTCTLSYGRWNSSIVHWYMNQGPNSSLLCIGMAQQADFK